MSIFLGVVIVLGSVFGGYLIEQGNIWLLFQPAELLIIFGGAVGGFQDIQEKITAIQKDTKERCTDVLTVEQRRTWQELVGDEFKLEKAKFDFGGAKKKKGG